VSSANRALTLVVSLGLVIGGVVNLVAGRVPLGTALVLIGILLGTMQVRSQKGAPSVPTLGSSLIIVFVVWVVLGLLIEVFVGRAAIFFRAGPHHSPAEGSVACAGILLLGYLFAKFSIGLRRGLQQLRRGQ